MRKTAQPQLKRPLLRNREETMTELDAVAEAAATPEAEEAAYLADLTKLNNQRVARLFRVEIDQEQLDVLRSMRFPAATGNANTDKGYRLLSEYLSRVSGKTLLELAVDYVRVFMGNTNEIDGAAFPYESVYTSEKRLRMQEARDEVLAIFRAYGLDKDESWKDAEDHVALELEFMKALGERADEALAAGDADKAAEFFAAQKNFLADHILNWVPMLTSDMRHFAKTDFYLALAYLTDGFLETDREFLADLLPDTEDED